MKNNELPTPSFSFFDENIIALKSEYAKKRGGPYSKKQRSERREKAFKLHFELGYPATKIAQKLNVNRNTIQSDIEYLYSKLFKKSEKFDARVMFMRQLARLESQRTRFLEELENETNFQKHQYLEKMILEIDSRIINFSIKLDSLRTHLFDYSLKIMNAIAEKNNLKTRYISEFKLNKTSTKTYEKISKLLDNDKKWD